MVDRQCIILWYSLFLNRFLSVNMIKIYHAPKCKNIGNSKNA